MSARFETELLGQQGDETEQQILQQQLSSAGIKTKIRLMEYGSYVERQTQRDWQMIIFGGRYAARSSSDLWSRIYLRRSGASQSEKKHAKSGRLLQQGGR